MTFSLFLAFWHIGICLLQDKEKVTQNFLIGRDPPPLLEEYHKKENKIV